MSDQFHAVKEDELLRALKTIPEGLSSEEARQRLETYGPNKLVEKGGVSLVKIFAGQFKDVFVLMLLVAIVISLITAFMKHETPDLEDYADSITIGVIVILNAVVGFVQEYRSERAMEALRRFIAPKTRVLRDRRETTIPAVEIVPGDVILLDSGDRVSADGRLIKAIDLRSDEAVLTGESTPVEKRSGLVRADASVGDRKNMVFMGTHTIYGRGRAVVIATGMKTEFGKIAEMMQAVKVEETPLKLRLNRFARKLGIFITVVCTIILLLGWFRGKPWIESFMTAVALAVSAVPEGLPAIVTAALALGARDLASRKAIIRKLSSAETLGAATIICSDKTGTLTKGQMTVRRVYCSGRSTEVTGSGYEPRGEFILGSDLINPKDEDALPLLLTIGALCNNSHLENTEDKWYVTGDPTEGALIVVAHKAGLKKEDLEKQYPRIAEVPFSSERKRMTTIHTTPQDELYAYVKGAPEIILACSSRVYEDGKEKRLTKQKKKKIAHISENFAQYALRVLGLAYRRLPESTKRFTEKIEDDLVFVGLIGMIDPPREEVKEARALCKKAGIKTVMITGDHKLTAVAVAREIGMLESDGLVLTGEELDKMSDEGFDEIVEDVKVYARVSPEHKLRVVRALKKKGHIVAMTGDGVNDAPALKTADIGVAMGITGTDVTREASDMVLADDNFATIVEAVRGGRTIYNNVRKFIRYLLSSNFDELLVISSFALAGLPLPLLPAMILWINLVTDGGPAIALSMDTPPEDVMEQHPRNPREGILHGMTVFIIAYVILQSGTTIATFWWKYFLVGGSLEAARTVSFMQACIFELVVVWNCRSERHNAFKVGFLSNRFLIVAVATSFLLTVSLCYVPILQVMFRTVPLGLYDWIWIFSTSTLGFIVFPEIFMRGRR